MTGVTRALMMLSAVCASPRRERAGSAATPRCYSRTANASLVDALLDGRVDAIGRELGRARVVLLRNERLETLPFHGWNGLSDAVPGAHAQLIALVTPASTEAACSTECARLDFALGESCRAYTWYGADASRALFGLAPSAERLGSAALAKPGVAMASLVNGTQPVDEKGVCVIATADAPLLSLSQRENTVAAVRVECKVAAGVATELGPDADFYISGRTSAHGMWAIFFGVLQSLGQTSVLVLGGLWLARRGMINAEGAKALSAIGMNLLIPALLFVRVLEAASIELLRTAWLAAALPFVYVPFGVAVGVACVAATKPGASFAKGMIVAVTFGNSTGLPIIILSVINSALMSHEVRALANEDRAAGASAPNRPPLDPLVYLSMYCMTYPLLQWGFGSVLLSAKLPGWLLRAAEPAEPVADDASPPPRRRLHTPLGAIALRGRRGIFGWWLPHEGRLLQGDAFVEAHSPLPPSTTPADEALGGAAPPLSVALDAAADGARAEHAEIAAGDGAAAAATAQAPQTPATPRDRHFVINVVDTTSGMLGKDAAAEPAPAEARVPPACAQIGRSATAHESELWRARGSGGLANAVRIARGAVQWNAPSEPQPANGGIPVLGRSLTAPGRAIATDAAAAIGSARRPLAGEHRRASFHQHHQPRTARLAVAINLDAIADAEAGLSVAPPMREAAVERVDRATGVHWIERVAFYEEGRQAAARALRQRRAASASALPRAGASMEGVIADSGGTHSDDARFGRAATQAAPTPRALLAAAATTAGVQLTSFLGPQRTWLSGSDQTGSLLRDNSAESGTTSTTSSDEETEEGARPATELGARLGGAPVGAGADAAAAAPAELDDADGGIAAQPSTPSRAERRLSELSSAGTDASSVHSLASPPPAPPPGVSARATDGRLPVAALPSAPALLSDKGPSAIPSQQTAPLAVGKAEARRWRHVRHGVRKAARFVFDKLLVPPVRATLLGLVLGLIPCVRKLLLPEASHASADASQPALAWLLAGISKLGDAAVPMNLITLGVSLAKGPDFDALPPRAALAIVFAKMVVMPAIALGAIVFVSVVCPVHILHPFQQPFFLTMFVVAATPTANNVLVMCTISGNDRTAMSTAIFVQYMCSPLILSLSICGFIAILVDYL